MGFTNRIRIPFQVVRPQYLTDISSFRYADGSTQNLSVVIKKTYEGETDYMPEKWHERLIIALSHDNVTIEGDKYLGGVARDGEYTIDWPKFKVYPTAKAAFSVSVTPFDNTNSNCQSCEEAIQLNLQDDTFLPEMDEGNSYTMNVADNDNICCYPSTFSITIFNTDYVESADLDNDGNLTVHLKAVFVSGSNIELLTYRVTCPNSAFDEAKVFGHMNGSEAACNAPSNINPIILTSTSIELQFDAAIPAPDHYLWKLYKGAILVQSGVSATIDIFITGLVPSTIYKFFVRSQCDSTNDDATGSDFQEFDFTTASDSDTCGEYIFNYPGFGGPGDHTNASYLDCNGTYQNLYIPANVDRVVCAAQSSPGIPESINPGAATFMHGDDSNCGGSTGSHKLIVGAGASSGDVCDRFIAVWITDAIDDIRPSMTVYTDAALTIPLTGKLFIGSTAGEAFHINSSTGFVGASTGIIC